ncbi:choice-of-anchor G family protein, partial [Microbacterium yannicii]|uniref:choice-of-anchor G family protein n=1 Tax=Microbacterium yannicii TaxID=671622 RepID=UPI00035CE54C
MTALAMFGGVTAAHAGPGDSSNATGTFLGGSILDLIDLDAVADIEGAAASNDGTPPTVTDFNNLDLTALSLVNVTSPGGIQIPINFAELGVVGQYASAGPNGDSMGASGLVGAGGVVGTGGPPPGPLSVDLTAAVDSLAGPVAANLVSELAAVDLTLEVVSATATQAAPAGPVGHYEIASGVLTIESATVDALSDALTAAVGGVQTDLDAVGGQLNDAVEGLLGLLAPLAQANLTVGTTSLTEAIADLLSEPLTDPLYPGVTIDLGEGLIIIDLDEIQPLNGQAPNTEILSEATILEIQGSVFALIDGLLDDAVDELTAAIEGLTVTGAVTTVLGNLVTVNTTVGALLDGDTSGIALAGVALNLPDGLEAVVAALASPLQDVIDSVNAIATTLIAPINSLVLPALGEILPLVASITVNNQSTSGGVFSETALRLTVLPTLDAVTVDLANATVGPNVNVTAGVDITSPAEGAEITAEDPSETADVPVSGTGESGASVTVAIEGQPSQTTSVTPEGTWLVTFTGLPVGDYTATATQTPGGSTDTVNFSVVEAVTAVDITAPAEGASIPVAEDESTTDVVVSGLGEAGETVEVTIEGEESQTATVQDDNTWTTTFPGLAVGEYTATATQSGDDSEDTVTFSVVETITDVDITAPVDGSTITVAEGPADVIVSGTGDPGESVEVTIPGQTPQTATVTPEGTWTTTFPALPLGTYTATATQTPGGSTDTVTFTVAESFVPVVIAAPTDGAELTVPEADDTREVVVSGTGDPGSTVNLALTGQDVRPLTVGTDGTWTTTYPALPVGEYLATAVQTSDNTSDSIEFSIVEEITDVAITAPSEGAELTVPETGDVRDVVVAGTGDPGESVELTLTGQPARTVTVDEDGIWTTTYEGLGTGAYTVTATQPADGSTDNSTFSIVEEIDDVTITDPTDGEVIVAPDPDGTIDVTVTGEGDPGSSVVVTVTGEEPQTVEVTPEGTWTATFDDLTPGEYTATATQTPGGSTAEVDFTVVDEVTDVVITDPTEGEEFTVPTADGTYDLTVTGEGEENAQVVVTIGDEEQTVTVSPEGTWTATFEDLPVGDYTVTATQEEGDGSTDSVNFSVVSEGVVDATDVTDADATDADADATDADATDADATDADADADTDADATDADADATDADADTDADAT